MRLMQNTTPPVREGQPSGGQCIVVGVMAQMISNLSRAGTVAYEVDAPNGQAPRQGGAKPTDKPEDKKSKKRMNMRGMKGM